MTPPISDALAELRNQFVDQLASRVETIHAHFKRLDLSAWQPAEAETLHRLVHGITGSAGTFGLLSVSDAARQLETRLAPQLEAGAAPTEAEWQVIAADVGHLQRQVRIQLQSDAPSLKPPAISPRLDQSPLIHLVEDDLAQAAHLGQALRDEGYRVEVFTELSSFRAVCVDPDAECPAAVVMDMIFPEGGTAGADLLAELKASGKLCPPVVFISVRDDLPARLAALRAGASRYLVKPVEPDQLIGLMDAITGRHPAEPYRVLMVDDDPLLLKVYASVLGAAGMEVRTLSNPLETQDVMDAFAPDVVVLDMYMPGVTGSELAAVLRERDAHLQLPILFLSAESDINQQLQALNVGGDDFLVKPVQPDYLVAAITMRARRARQNRAIHRRLEKILYEREREHLALDQHAIVSIADRAGNILYANDKFCAISGYTRGELLGHTHRIVKSDAHPPDFYQDLWHTIASGKVWQGEVCNRSKDGSLYWVESTITPFLDGDGMPYQYVSIRTDITHIKMTEAALRESDALQHAILDSMPSQITVLDRDGIILSVNESWRRFALENAAEPGKPAMHTEIGVNYLDVCQASRGDSLQGAQEAIEGIRKVLEGRLPNFSLEYPCHSPNQQRWFTMSVTPLNVDNHGVVIAHSDITQLKFAQQATEAHKERLRRGQMFANVGTWDWNIQTDDLLWTERIAPLFGYPVGELETSYDNFLAAIHPDDRQAVIDAVNACVERDVPYEIEHRVVWPDGTVRWLLERGAVAHDAEGRPLQMLGVVQDIDDRKRAELALAERERQLREAQSLARIGNWKADLVTGALIWSDEIYRIFGHEPDSFEPSVEAFQATVHPDDRLLVEESEKRAEKTGCHDVVHRIVLPDGSVRHVHELARMEVDADGNPVRMIGTVQDITVRVEAEARLRESESKLSGLFELSPLGIALTDMDGRYLEYNAAFQAICGYPAEELKNLDYWTLTPREYAAQEAQQLESLKKTGRYGPYEKTYRQKNGTIIPIRLNGILVVDQTGQSKIWSIVEDISDSKRIEEALIAARDEADRANQAKSEFLSSMSHELRTPMNAILGFSQLMEYDDALPGEHQDSVQEILKAGHHLLELINEVLDLAKVESGSIDLSLEPVEVCPIVDECLSLVSPMADERQIRVMHTGLTGAAVRADRMRLKQALLNLLSNAIKYNRTGGSVKLDVLSEGSDRLRIRVTDTGQGIPAWRMKELFKPFNRLDADSSGIEGTGIGLTITRRIVELMGGSVDVQSEIGVGSSFWIELPLESLPDAERGHESASGGSATRTQRDGDAQHTVLYIEDNPSNIKLVAQILGRRKHIHLLTAHTPELGIELALMRHPELILLEINMPGMDGYQVLEVFKADARLKAIPVVAVTANAMTRDIERGKAAGFIDYLTKPLDVVRFHAVIDVCLEMAGKNNA